MATYQELGVPVLCDVATDAGTQAAWVALSVEERDWLLTEVSKTLSTLGPEDECDGSA